MRSFKVFEWVCTLNALMVFGACGKQVKVGPDPGALANQGAPVSSGQSDSDKGQVLAGPGAPAQSLGAPGNVYIDINSGFYYTKNLNGVWQKSGSSLRQGPAGVPGVAGKDGNKITTGEGAPATTFGNGGDLYVDVSSGYVYTKDDSGGWEKSGFSLKGAEGKNGTNGTNGSNGSNGTNGSNGATGPSGNAGQTGDDGLEKQRADCDDLRNELKGEFMKQRGNELVTLLDEIYIELGESGRSAVSLARTEMLSPAASSAEKDADYSKFTQVIGDAMRAVGMKAGGDFFGGITNSVDGRQQTYLGVSRQYGVLASVHREITEDGVVTALKLNWEPNASTYSFSVHILDMTSNRSLNDKAGYPQQDLIGHAAFTGRLFDLIERESRMVNCRGITRMTTADEQEAFSTVKAGQSQ